MKRTYMKPEIIFENFALTTNIAGDCEVKTSTPNSGSCPYTWEDEFGSYSVFVDSSVCGNVVADGNDGICYHVPTETNSVFNS